MAGWDQDAMRAFMPAVTGWLLAVAGWLRLEQVRADAHAQAWADLLGWTVAALLLATVAVTLATCMRLWRLQYRRLPGGEAARQGLQPSLP